MTTVERIEQSVMFVENGNKRRLLADIIHRGAIEQAIVFTRTKHGANRLVKQLDQEGIEAQAIHGNKSQNARTKALDAFRAGDLAILVATDVASRGIDVDGISHVVNFDLPNEPESYVHRIGRTGRAGRPGIAIAFCSHDEGAYLRDIEKLIGETIPVETNHAWHAEDAIPGLRPTRPPPPGNRGRQPRGPSRKPSGARPSGGGPPSRRRRPR